MGSEDMEMAGGASQRVDIGLNSLSGRSVQSDQYSRSMAVAKRADPVNKVRPGEGFGEYSDPQKFLGRERPGFLNADRDYREANEGFHLDHRVQKDNGGDADERKNLYLGSQMTGLGVGRDQDWGSGERGVGTDAEYRDIGVVRESEVSQSEGTEEEDEDEGEIEGDGDTAGLGERGRDMVLGERGIQHSQMTPLEGRSRQDSMVPSSRGVEGFQRPASDRDRGMKVSTSTSQAFGLYLQPQGTGLSFLNYGTTSPSGGQMATHVEANAAQNGGVGPGVGPGMPSPYGMREGGISRDTYAKGLAARENSLASSLHEQQSQEHLHESLQSSEDNYYTALLNSTGPNNNAQKGHDLGNDVGGPGLKRNSRMLDSPSSAEPSLRRILSDPFSGQLMEDATIFACGHSFGNTGLEQVLATSACLTCGVSVRNTSMAANYALRAAVQAFKREEENSALNKAAKRRRDRPDQDQGTPSDQQPSSDGNRSKGVQFPFSVSERVLIKGNKRTPERFVGREAIITNQCLNGWYLVRTLDNGESVRLQYRSLQKVGGQPSPTASHFGPGWL